MNLLTILLSLTSLSPTLTLCNTIRSTYCVTPQETAHWWNLSTDQTTIFKDPGKTDVTQTICPPARKCYGGQTARIHRLDFDAENVQSHFNKPSSSSSPQQAHLTQHTSSSSPHQAHRIDLTASTTSSLITSPPTSSQSCKISQSTIHHTTIFTMKLLLAALTIGVFLINQVLGDCAKVAWVWSESPASVQPEVTSNCFPERMCQDIAGTPHSRFPVLTSLTFPDDWGCTIWQNYNCAGRFRTLAKSETTMAGNAQLWYEWKSFVCAPKSHWKK
ncbi:hypothetical protein EG327_009283 [Venturia inaequalis]|uniref:Uncharacterized protein n=1 Tax=Venturia inaequalis TaxID=5025 RepID=A0A8H3ULZ2_VENIN|nr:hypothetical protein EG327_009283 [Venturia inaequalis]